MYMNSYVLWGLLIIGKLDDIVQISVDIKLIVHCYPMFDGWCPNYSYNRLG